MPALYALLVGIAMGALLQRVRASSPGMILANLRLENLSIIKFMATTIAVGMILVYLLDAAAPQLLHFDIKPTYLIGVALGGVVGALLFTLVYTVLLEPIMRLLDLGKVRLQDYVHLPAIAVALIVAGALLTMVRLLPTTRGTPR